MPFLIFNYLLHRRCWKTAAVVARDMLSAPPDAAAAGGDAAAVADKDGSGIAPMDASGGGVAGAAAHAPAAALDGDQHMSDACTGAAAVGAPAAAPSAAAGGSGAAGGAALGQLSQADIQDALLRQRVYDAVCQGRVDDALDAVAAQYGAAVLDSAPRLAFKLKVQHFVELVRRAGSGSSSSSASGSVEEALAYGRSELGPRLQGPQDEELLSDALSLLAYADPAASPCGHLLRESSRAELAEELNGALLKVRWCCCCG